MRDASGALLAVLSAWDLLRFSVEGPGGLDARLAPLADVVAAATVQSAAVVPDH